MGVVFHDFLCLQDAMERLQRETKGRPNSAVSAEDKYKHSADDVYAFVS